MEPPGLKPLDPARPAVARFVERALASDVVGLLALRHALAHGLPGFWGDDPHAPASLLFVREGDGVTEAFGLGAPDSAVGWLAGLRTPVALAAPAHWRRVVEARFLGCQRSTVITCILGPPGQGPGAAPRVAVRQLTAHDEAAFAAVAPQWALRGWVTFDALLTRGAAFGVPHGDGFASLAWVFDETDHYDALATCTMLPFRRLGLARASALALREHVRGLRRKLPLWSASADNRASLALAASLGFVPRIAETILHWPPQRPPTVVEPTEQSDMM
ncbi:MAG: GNAT family N-acetyltransferase [Isosphaeraceae bacterium]|nr:GNAT family N-acetyltransferase [Isosphaeraceae bacterium]